MLHYVRRALCQTVVDADEAFRDRLHRSSSTRGTFLPLEATNNHPGARTNGLAWFPRGKATVHADSRIVAVES